MKIRIRSADTKLSLWLPTNLVFSKTVAKLGNTIGRKYAGDAMQDLPPEVLERLFAEFRRIKKRYGSWQLVDIESTDGSIIEVVL